MEQQLNHWDNTQSQSAQQTNANEISNDWRVEIVNSLENKRYVSEEPSANVYEVIIES